MRGVGAPGLEICAARGTLDGHTAQAPAALSVNRTRIGLVGGITCRHERKFPVGARGTRANSQELADTPDQLPEISRDQAGPIKHDAPRGVEQEVVQGVG